MIPNRKGQVVVWVGAMAVLCSLCTQTVASTIDVGVLSYDTFISAGNGSPGVDAFNVSNLTGSFSLPPDFPVVDDLIFQSATLTLNPISQVPEVFNLGDIVPGFLLDSSGNPVVQAPSNQAFGSAEFTSTLSVSQFALADGTTFTAVPTIDVLILPSQGTALTVDVDQTTIQVSSPTSSVPEPGNGWIVLLVAPWVLRRKLSR